MAPEIASADGWFQRARLLLTSPPNVFPLGSMECINQRPVPVESSAVAPALLMNVPLIRSSLPAVVAESPLESVRERPAIILSVSLEATPESD